MKVKTCKIISLFVPVQNNIKVKFNEVKNLRFLYNFLIFELVNTKILYNVKSWNWSIEMEVELDLTDNNTGLIKSQNMIILTGHLYNKRVNTECQRSPFL